jgi:GTP-binding protein YchF
MKIGITGISNAGKTTVFNALTGLDVEATAYPTSGGEPNMGVVKVPDARLDVLSDIFKPKKTTPSIVHYIDYMGLTKGDIRQNRKVFEFIKDADVLVHVVRAFEDDAVAHPIRAVDPVSDVMTVEAELLLGDLELVERRLESMEQGKKKGKKQNEEERRVLLRCKEALEAERPLRDMNFTGQERDAMRHLQFMSIKPEVVVLNISEKDLNGEEAAKTEERVRDLFAGKSSVHVVTLCGRVEMDIAEMPRGERGAFLEDLGITEPALERLIRVSYENLGLLSFFTVGSDEVRAWAIRKGTDALHAAGKIHSDIQRGFIRAEVVSYGDFIASGSMSDAREKGLLRLEGKSYEVKDGDIITYRFNV